MFCCSIHYRQVIQRKVKKYNLFRYILAAQQLKKLLKPLVLWLLLMKKYIIDTFNSLKNSAFFPLVLTQIYDYIFSTFISSKHRDII